MAAHEKDTSTSSMNEAEVTQDTSAGDENGADIESGGASAPSQEQQRPSRALDSDAIQAMTRSWTWGRSEDDDDDSSEENESMSPPYVDAGTLEEATLPREATSAAPVEATPKREATEERLDSDGEDEKHAYNGDGESGLHPPVAFKPPPDDSKDEDVNEKDAYRLPRRTAPARTSLLDINAGENGEEPTNRVPPPEPRGMPDIEARPGAVAMHGRGPGRLPVWARDQRQESPSNQNRSRRVLLPFRRESVSNVETADITTANAVDDAETILVATSVSPDETAKYCRIAIGVGILGLAIIIGLATGLTLTKQGVGVQGTSSVVDPRCLLPVDEQDVFAHCDCNNTTEGLEWTEEEERYYDDLQAQFLNESIISEPYLNDSCSFENQCLIFTANYERRNISEDVVPVLRNATEYAIQLYAMCLTYLHFDGRHWEHSEGWVETDAPCTWFGVSCSFLSRVTGLDLSSNGLNGTFPSEICHLPFLRDLDLSRNPAVEGTIPRELSQAHSLQLLDLSNTNMSGTIPSEIEDWEILERLVLSNNSFSGTIPVNITKLDRLRELCLGHNDFTGTLPTELGELTRLEELSLGHNGFIGTLPAELGRLKHLEIFRINNNKLNGTIPLNFGHKEGDEERGKDRSGWKYLEEINLSFNNFTGPFPSFLESCDHLVSILIHDTQLTGSIPESFCKREEEEQPIVIMDCNRSIDKGCSCCDELAFCKDRLPPSLQDLV